MRLSKPSRRERREQKRLQEGGARVAPPVLDAELIPNQTSPAEAVRPSEKTARRVMMEFQSFAGPIPPPEILGQYEQVSQGAANRILTQFEEQGRHRRVLERRALNYNIISATIGQISGLILFLFAIGVGGFLIYHDKSAEGIAAIISAVGGAAWVLRKAEVAKKSDLASKREDGRKK